MAAEGSDGWSGSYGHPGAPGNGLRGAGRAAGHHWALHLDPLPGRICSTGTIPHPGTRTRLVTRPDDRGHHPAPGWREWKSSPRRSAGIDAGHPGRRHDDPGRSGEAGLRGRPSLQANPDRLHDRSRPHHPGRSAAQAVRFLDSLRHADWGYDRIRERGPVGGDRHRGRPHRVVRTGRHSRPSSACCRRSPVCS